jgi:hypothetical protein
MTLESRIPPPPGFTRTAATADSFDEWLRKLPLKKHNAEVLLFDGRSKPNYNVYDAVVDLPIGKKDLHQCADAVMRLRAEYLWKTGQFGKIHFNLTNGFRVDYSEWMQGNRIVVSGNKTTWQKNTSPSNTYKDFWSYMELVFSYAGTLSLAKELTPAGATDVRIGDVFIQGGSPGHAVVVVDVAFEPGTRRRVFLIAQSYMPAQEIQILKNPNDAELSPWYSTSLGEQLITPEWRFQISDRKYFVE